MFDNLCFLFIQSKRDYVFDPPKSHQSNKIFYCLFYYELIMGFSLSKFHCQPIALMCWMVNLKNFSLLRDNIKAG